MQIFSNKILYLQVGGIFVEVLCNIGHHLGKLCLHRKRQTEARVVWKVLVDKFHSNLQKVSKCAEKIILSNWVTVCPHMQSNVIT